MANRILRFLLTATICCSVASAASLPGSDAGAILDAVGVQGGLVVHLECGDGKLTAALRANDGYLVHGLDTDPRNVRNARLHVQSLGRYGEVSIDGWDGKRLPYVDNLVNLIVSRRPIAAPMSEVMRVLVPNGVAYIKTDGKWVRTVGCCAWARDSQ